MCQSGVEYVCDDVSNAALDPVQIRQARDLDTKLFTDLDVFTLKARAEQVRCSGKIIKTRLIDMYKGDATEPNYRSRLVGKEIRTHAHDL